MSGAARLDLRSPIGMLLMPLMLLASCGSDERPAAAGRLPGDSAAGASTIALYDPSRDLGALFVDAQMTNVYPDSKTLLDARPRRDPADILVAFAKQRTQRSFSLARFMAREFVAPRAPGGAPERKTAARAARATRTMEEHIEALWPTLTRPADVLDARSSLLPLPKPYVVATGGARELSYWDSYFTMLGLVQSGKLDLVTGMLDNFAHLARTYGHIPSGNRSYYLSRSHPPYFSAMVGLYAQATDSSRAAMYLDAMEAEHAYWMSGADTVAKGAAHRRVVRMADGALLNRYWDDRPEPRPEAFREDFAVAQALPEPEREAFYRNVRAAAESGWNLSSRWMRNPRSLASLETTELIPVDLNSLLYHAEHTIAALRRVRDRDGDEDVAEYFESLAAARKAAVLALSYDTASGFFYDVRWRSGARVLDRPTMAAVAPLYFGLATNEQAARVTARLEREFLKPGGFTTTLIASGQQWDAPYGWPPMQWLAIEGVRRYRHMALADSARARWLALNRKAYDATGRMTEMFDVWDLSRKAGSGESSVPDGFGWTNGVALRLSGAR